MRALEKFFNQIAKDLDLTEAEYNTIVSSYEEIGKCLTESSKLKGFSPNVFPQGSVRLGTIVKPLKKDDYDIDLVCELNKCYLNLSAEQVKQTVGEALKNSVYAKQLEEEHGRCWTVRYNSNPSYHVDILPGVSLANDRVKATNFLNGKYRWLYTNPKGFANWFLSLKKQVIKEKCYDSVERVSEYDEKTVLQRVVQIIKRHRDVYFKDNPEEGPASVIITALAGLSYNNEVTIEDILKNGPIEWISHIRVNDNKLSIRIPSLPDDDYADKWNEDGEKPVKNFLKWHRQLIIDLDDLFNQINYDKFIKIAKKLFTDSSIDKISNNPLKITDSLKESFERNYSSTKIKTKHSLFEHAQTLPIGTKYMPSMRINAKLICRVYNNEQSASSFTSDYEYEFYEFSPILEKGKHLSFKAIITSHGEEKYHVKWQVTNTGKEAKNLEGQSQLRGEFIDEKIGNKKEYLHTESTTYAGTHFIQFFVFKTETKNGRIVEVCIAKSKLITVNIGA